METGPNSPFLNIVSEKSLPYARVQRPQRINRKRPCFLKEKIVNGKLRVTSISLLIVLLAACGGGGSGGTPESSSSGGGSSQTGTEPPPSAEESPPSAAARTAAPPPPGTVEFAAAFPDLGHFRSSSNPSEGWSNDGMWWVEQRAQDRAVVVNVGRDGGPGLRLHTDPGDNNISGSGAFERNDVALMYTDGVQGREQWWAHSILFPDDFAVPPWEQPTSRAIVFDFHDTRNQGGQANFHVAVQPGGLLTFRGNAGPTVAGDEGNQYSYGADIGPLARNVWYDFVYHVKWSWNSDGFMRAWVNGVLKLDHRGPTLYEGYGVYLKLANYHTAFGQNSSSVIHDRVIRGTTWQIVSLTSLEGVYP